MFNISDKVKELREYKHMADDINSEITKLTDLLKNYMTETKQTEIRGTDWKITFLPVTSCRLDTAALKKAHPEIAEQFTKTFTFNRFSLQ